MRVHYLQHVPFEGLGYINHWLEQEEATVTSTELYETTSLPPADEIDLLIILGGPMSVNDEEQYPWLRLEKNFIRQVIDADKAVLGICLGAQLIACVLGEEVYPNRRKEIGWFPIEGLSLDNSSLFQFPRRLEVFHWHGETFDLPTKAIQLARSDGCEIQAFQVGPKIIGLQFHLESTPDTVKLLVDNCGDEILPSKYVQPESVIFDQGPEKFETIHQLLTKVLSYLQENSR